MYAIAKSTEGPPLPEYTSDEANDFIRACTRCVPNTPKNPTTLKRGSPPARAGLRVGWSGLLGWVGWLVGLVGLG